MIQPQELRIGNLVGYGVNIVPVKSIHTESVLKNRVDIYVELNDNLPNHCVGVDELSPIPLTPEILEKAGVKDVWIKNSWMIVEDVSGGESFGWSMKVRNASYTKEIEFAYFKYLHQLQNLYYALTGEELPINL